jgi:diamine N-acetyltransferase
VGTGENGGAVEAPIVNIVGERIAMGPHRRDLLPTYLRWINDFTALRSLAIAPGPMTMEQEERWYDHPVSDQVRFTVYERETWRPVGSTDLRNIDFRNRTAVFGILIGEADARGKGYGTEATALTLDYAFTALSLQSVMLTVAEYNLAGRRAYEKAGFTEFGRRRQCRLMGGRIWDDVYMDCLASEFTSPVLARVFAPDTPR